MREDIGAATLGLDEAKALGVVEPLDSTDWPWQPRSDITGSELSIPRADGVKV
jgi:hypothetical protein